MSTLPFQKVKFPHSLKHLLCSVPTPKVWHKSQQDPQGMRVEAALIRIASPWDPARFDKKMQTVVEQFPLLRASLSPSQQAIAIHEGHAIRWRLLESPEFMHQVLHKGWTNEIQSMLNLSLENNQLWEALVAVDEDEGFIVCLTALPIIADSSMLHAALGSLELQFRGQAPSAIQREILARERLTQFIEYCWASYHSIAEATVCTLPPSLPAQTKSPMAKGSCTFRLPSHAWHELVDHARSHGLPSFTVAAILMRAALQRLLNQDIGSVLYKNSLRFPKTQGSPGSSGWEALQAVSHLDDSFTEWLKASKKIGWTSMPDPQTNAWPAGLWIGVGLLPASTEAQQLRILSCDPGPTSLLWLCPDGDGETFLSWQEDCWDEEFPMTLATVIKELAEQWSESPERSLNSLPIHNIVLPLWQRWNSSYKAWHLEQTIPQLLGPAIAKAADKIAIRSRQGDLSFRQLDVQSKQVALWLKNKNIGLGDLIGIALPRTPALLVTMLGILRAGAGYVPLDPNFPAERLQYMLNDSKVKGCFCQEAILADLAPSCSAWIWDDVKHQLPEFMADQWQDPAQDPSSIAYLIYTSGSTGKPKGVMLGHRSIVNFLLSMQQKPGMESSDCILAITTLSFDIAVLELLLPLLCGASLYLTSAEEGKDGKLLRAIVEAENITIFQATPSKFRLLLDAGWSGSNIRKALCGGEPFPVDIARRLLPLIPEVWNMYGPTETSVWSTIHLIRDADELIPIGGPIANTAVYILDEQLNPVLPGEKGEIYIGGSGLALGYYERPELTRERFQMIPSLSALAYKTGDIGRYKWNGVLEIFGRSDQQIKLLGYRIELGEIESVITSFVGVEQCVAAVKDFATDDPRLVAYVTTNDSFQERNIREAARAKLPQYMLPAHYVVLPAIPLLPNGKIDRKQLPHPREVPAATAALEPIPLAVPQQENVETPALSPSRAAPVIAAAANPPQGVAPLQFLPLTPSQSRMLFTEELDPETTVHNIVGAWVIHGAMDFQAFRRAFEALVIEHDSLRMAAVSTKQGYAQQLFPPFSPELRIYGREKSQMTLDEVSLAIMDIAREKIDATQVPNFRMGLFRLNTNSTVFFLITHHLFWDGFSYDVMWKSTQRHYKDIVLYGRAQAVPPEFNFSHYALQRQIDLQSPEIQTDLDYWLKVYQQLPDPLELPYDHTRPAVFKHNGSTAWIPWDTSVDTKLQNVAKTIGCSVYHLLLSAYYVLLYRSSGQTDLVVGTPVHGRQQAETFKLIGNFINIVAIRQKIEPNMSFLSLVELVKAATSEAISHSHLPFESLVAALKLPRDAGRTPLYNTMLFYQDHSLQKIQFGSSYAEGLPLPNASVDSDLVLCVERYHHKTFAGFNFRVDLWEQSTIDSMAQSFRQVLDLLLAEPEQTVKKPSLVSDQQREKLINTWNHSELTPPPLQTLPAIFDERVRLTAHAIAVQELNGEHITWEDLDIRVKQLAFLLRQCGIRTGAVVGLYHSRNIDMVVGLLAILRIGAAYLPLDPAFPIDRIQFMLQNAAASLLVTESHYREQLHNCSIPLICIDEEKPQLEKLDPALDKGPLPESDDVAYVIYTSGSTGKPKGVEIQQKAIASFLNSFRSAVDLPALPRTLAITTISFDISVLEIFGTLAWGGTVVLVDSEKLVDGPALIKALSDQKINLMQATPATWRLLIESRWSGKNDLTALCGGEALPRDLAKELIPRTKALWNVYGPTEATVWATAAHIKLADEPITIGKILPNYEAYILDEDRQLLPIGAIGSLYLGGPALAKGYRNLPELTLEQFIPHPFKPGEKIYDTGDLCRYRADGQLEYLSRKDNQIKLRGFRIELGEIETIIASMPEVKTSVVMVREDQPGDHRLVAYTVCKAGVTLNLAQLHQTLKQTLPLYMLPNHLVLLDDLPLTGSGKIDRKALPKPQDSALQDGQVDDSRRPIPDLSYAEARLAEIWREMIGVKNVRPTDNFFDLGGHSLLALKVLNRCQQELAATFKIRDLLLMNLAQLAGQLPQQSTVASQIKGESS